jgi:hypothetical protein
MLTGRRERRKATATTATVADANVSIINIAITPLSPPQCTAGHVPPGSEMTMGSILRSHEKMKARKEKGENILAVFIISQSMPVCKLRLCLSCEFPNWEK